IEKVRKTHQKPLNAVRKTESPRRSCSRAGISQIVRTLSSSLKSGGRMMLRHNQNAGKKNLGLPRLFRPGPEDALKQGLHWDSKTRLSTTILLVVFWIESYAALNTHHAKNRQVRSGVKRKAVSRSHAPILDRPLWVHLCFHGGDDHSHPDEG